MAQSSDSGVETEPAFALVCQEIFDFVGGNLGAIFITGALCDDDNGLSLSHFAVLEKEYPEESVMQFSI